MEPMDQKRHDELQKDLITGEPGDRDHPDKPGFYGWLINSDYPQRLEAADKLQIDIDSTDGDRFSLPTHRLLRACLSSRKSADQRVRYCTSRKPINFTMVERSVARAAASKA